MSKTVETWMPWYIDKYLGDTTNLTTEQHGAYCLLLMSMWKKQGLLPNDDKQLAPIAKLSLGKWRSYRPVLIQFFRVSEDGRFISQKRVSKELTRALAISDERSKAGKEGAARKRVIQEERSAFELANGIATAVANASANAKQNATPIPKTPSLRSGSEAIASVAVTAAPSPPKRRKAKAEVDPEPPTNATWEAYSEAYRRRYRIAPLRNGKVNKLLLNFLGLVPAEHGPAIAAFYVGHQQNLYVNAKHAVELLFRDAERLYADWMTNSAAGVQQIHGTETANHRQLREMHAALSGNRVASATAPAPPAQRSIDLKQAQEVLDVIPTDLLR